jgi:recombinational DNA repair ATPase RecF
MDTKKVVFNKLFSTEAKKAQKLSKQRKISLSLMDKMESYLSSIQGEIIDAGLDIDDAILTVRELESKIESASELLQNLEGRVVSYQSYKSQVGDLLDQYRSAADDLGINPEDNNVYNDLSDILDGDMADARTEAESVIYDLKQYIK